MTEQTKNRQAWEAEIIAKAWQDEAFKQELSSNPKAVLSRELGLQNISESFEIRVVEETPNTLYLVLPMPPQVAAPGGELSEEQLETVAGGGFTPATPLIVETVVSGVKSCLGFC